MSETTEDLPPQSREIFADVCMLGGTILSPPPNKRLENIATLRSLIFVTFTSITLKRENFTEFKALF